MISINLINWNNGDVIDGFIGAFEYFLGDLDYPYEVILVDNISDDGSYESLEPYSRESLQVKSSRGKARNIALDLGSGDITVDCLDTDTRVQPVLAKIVNWYYEERPDYCINTQGSMINRRDIVEKYGFGYYQLGEDKYLWEKLGENEEYVFLDIVTAEDITDIHNHPRNPPKYPAEYRYPDFNQRHRDKDLEAKFNG